MPPTELRRLRRNLRFNLHLEATARENLLISTSDSFRYEWMSAPRNRQGVVIELRVGSSPSRKVGPVQIALSETQNPSDRMYRITVGDADNTLTWIGRKTR
ncbi:hypothetical protein HHI36_024240 [Cryptolaemus montrouzieri]|uniref:Farnesoic acid O-methyl transferase domain-containing protein n=1 Tax=Cryptolaemus montrouzieri TaxID=559131 RepID=A0ABD2NP28_9CUCU